jgi:hypothetical protein
MLTFNKLWENYPTILGEKTLCKTDGKINFDDQCAIRLGSTLSSNGVDTLKIVSKGRHCWQHGASDGHILAAEELATGLNRLSIDGIGKLVKLSPSEFQREISNKQGIIFFKDFWQRTNTKTGKKESYRNRSGDHIDLWNGSRLTDWKTWFLISSTLNTNGAYGKSKEIWFWRIL